MFTLSSYRIDDTSSIPSEPNDPARVTHVREAERRYIEATDEVKTFLGVFCATDPDPTKLHSLDSIAI